MFSIFLGAADRAFEVSGLLVPLRAMIVPVCQTGVRSSSGSRVDRACGCQVGVLEASGDSVV